VNAGELSMHSTVFHYIFYTSLITLNIHVTIGCHVFGKTDYLSDAAVQAEVLKNTLLRIVA
jgi:hypothetical protein